MAFDTLPLNNIFPPDDTFPGGGGQDPAVRMATRQAAGREIARTALGNGRKFSFTSTPSGTLGGQVMYGPTALAYDLTEALADGAVHTQDFFLAAALRGTGLFTEVAL